MELLKVKIHGYRRFKDSSEMNVDGKLIAIIGPNEAGKSSFLRALLRINDTDPIVESGGSQELTRGVEFGEDHRPIVATYLIDESDRIALDAVPGCESARWFTVSKRLSGNFYVSLSPDPTRPLRLRRELVKSLKRALPKLRKREQGDSEVSKLLDETESLASELATDLSTLNEDLLERTTALGEKIEKSGVKDEYPSLNGLSTQINELVEFESRNLHTEATNILFKRRPKFLHFGSDEINLSSEYDLSTLNSGIPTALRNLAGLADLDLKKLAAYVAENDQGQIETVTRGANQNLANLFAESWSQSRLEVVFRVSGATLSILVGEEGSPYVRIAERSDGLRRYVALFSFMKLRKNDERSILLIDEAETHLHYDAQADLVQMLAKQRLTSKVIYTTHSIGCLPEDLGSGVRQIEALDAGFSRVQNWFWESDAAGFSPLLFGMGAGTLAFVPVRYALVTEGAADMILLPRMFRESSSSQYLGFQVVPGLSEADQDRIIQLEQSSPRTVFLGDGDGAGLSLIQKVKRMGIDPNRLFNLPDPKKEGLVTEDFLELSAYTNAVNEELRRSHGDMFRIAEKEFIAVNRPARLSEWCKKQGIKSPSKRAIAYRILELEPDKGIVASQKRKQLASLVTKIKEALQITQESHHKAVISK